MAEKTVLMILAPANFRDEEYYETREVLEKHGLKVVIASEAQIAESKFGKKEEVDLLLDELDTEYGALIFVGGGGSREYYSNTDLHALAKQFLAENKIVAAICAAPGILAHAGMLQGKKATCSANDEEMLKSKGAIFVKEPVVIEGNLITGEGPTASKAFGEAIAKKLAKD